MNETRKKPAPIVLWAALGALCIVMQCYVFGAWIASSDFRPTDPGPDPVPPEVLNTIHNFERFSITLGLLALVWFAWGIWRNRRIDVWRLLMIGWLSSYWLDPWLDFLRPMFTYNAYATNFGSWAEFIPGWQSPNGSRIAEPLLIDPSAYFWNFTLATFIPYWVMRLVRSRWPGLPWPLLILTGFAGVWASMGLIDINATFNQRFDAWPIAFQSWSFFGGQPYQFPIYEFILFPSAFVACATLVLFSDENGLTVIERGSERFSGGVRTALRILAFIAVCNLANFLYTTGMGIHALFADPWPKDMPSWLSDEQCGPVTGRVCPATASSR